MITSEDILALLEWGPPKEILTKRGPRIVRKADANEPFLALWKSRQPELYEAGISFGEYRGKWEVTWWRPLEDQQIAQRAAALEASRAPVADIEFPEPDGLRYLPYQRAGIAYGLGQGARGASGTLIADEMGLGKAQPLTAKILTPTGWATMGRIKFGAEVVGSDGRPTIVTGVYDLGERPVYRVSFSDGSSTECCAEHLWYVNSPLRKWRGLPGRAMELSEIEAAGLHDAAGNAKFFIPLVEPVHFEFGIGDADALPIDPYLLGVLIGDGGLTHSIMVSSEDDEILSEIRRLLPADAILKHSDRCTYRIVNKASRRGGSNPVMDALRELGLFGHKAEGKFIPGNYLYASVEARVSLLQGLLDTDGYCSKDSTVQFYTVSDRLSADAIALVQSLGGVARHSIKETASQDCHILTLALPPEIQPFRLSRKAGRYRPRVKYQPARAIVDIEFVANKETRCIRVAARDHLYVTDDFVLTHNTIEALGIINADASIGNGLIICPKSAKLNWKREADKWLTRPMQAGIVDADHWPHGADLIIINYEQLKKWEAFIQTREWDICIVDEAHFIKDGKTQRAERVRLIRAKWKLRLTGTPIVNRPKELFNLISDLHPAWADFWPYAKRYCNATKRRMGRKTFWDFDGSSNMAELQKRLRETVMIRRMKAEVLPDLPAKIRQIIEIEPEGGPMQAAIARDAIADDAADARLASARAAVELAKAESEQAYQDAVARLEEEEEIEFTAMSAIRHETALAKVPAVIEFLGDLLDDDPGRKVIVAAHHHDVIDAIVQASRERGWGPVSLTGSDNDRQRNAAVDGFQSDPAIRVFVGSIQAAGVAITLTAASIVIFAELDWVPGNVSQMEDRAHRIGQRDMVMVYHLVLAGSIDARIARMIVAKQAVIDQALNNPIPADLYLPDRAPRAPKAYQARQPAATEDAGLEQIAAEALAMPQMQIDAAHTAMRYLAGMDTDFASVVNGVGFNKIDGQIGHSLAERLLLSPRQAVLACKLAGRYRRQLPAELLGILGIER